MAERRIALSDAARARLSALYQAAMAAQTVAQAATAAAQQHIVRYTDALGSVCEAQNVELSERVGVDFATGELVVATPDAPPAETMTEAAGRNGQAGIAPQGNARAR